jgi:hypothetical protein
MALSGIASARDAILSLVPHRADLAADVRSRVDLDLYARQLGARTFSASDWGGLLRYLGGLLLDLQAPARGPATRAWLADAEVHVRAIAQRRADAKAAAGRAKLAAAGGTPILTPALAALRGPGGGSAAAAAADGAASPTTARPPQPSASSTAPTAPPPPPPPILDDDLLSLLPRFLAWVHWHVGLVRLDISNHQLSLLVPYLQTAGRGAEYERGRFAAAVRAALASSAAVASAGAGRVPQSSATVAGLPLTADYRIARLALLRDGALALLSYDVPLTTIAAAAAQGRPHDGVVRLRTTPAAAAGGEGGDGVTASSSSPSSSFTAFLFPEVLALDAKRLTDGQNTLQRLAVVATLGALVAQVAATAPPLATLAPGLPPAHPALGAAQVDGVATQGDVEARLAAWLADDGIRLDDVVNGVVGAADALCRRAGRLPLLVPSSSPAALTPAQATQVSSVRESGGRLGATLRSAATKAISSSHPLYATYARRVTEALRFGVTRALQDSLPPGAEARHAAEFPPWGAALVVPGAPLPPHVAGAVPAACAADLAGLSRELARLLRHAEAVHEPTLKALLAAEAAAGAGAGAGATSATE